MRTHRRSRVAIGGVVAALLGALLAGGACSKKGAAARPAEADPKAAVYQAALDAPLGKTDCESVLNAFKAMDRASGEANIAPPWDRLPAEDEFYARCKALPPDAQHCVIPRSQRDEHEKCVPVLDKLGASAEGKAFFALIHPPGAP